MALNRSDKSRILRRYFPGMTRNSEMSTEPRQGTYVPSGRRHIRMAGLRGADVRNASRYARGGTHCTASEAARR